MNLCQQNSSKASDLNKAWMLRSKKYFPRSWFVPTRFSLDRKMFHWIASHQAFVFNDRETEKSEKLKNFAFTILACLSDDWKGLHSQMTGSQIMSKGSSSILLTDEGFDFVNHLQRSFTTLGIDSQQCGIGGFCRVRQDFYLLLYEVTM